MAKKSTGGHPDLKMVNPGAAAIDIGSKMHMAAVNPDSTQDAVARVMRPLILPVQYAGDGGH